MRIEKTEPGSKLDKVLTTYKKLEPFIAIFVLVCVIISCVYLVKYVNNQKEIKENCGWSQNETYYCYCGKDFVIQKQNEWNLLQSLNEKGVKGVEIE